MNQYIIHCLATILAFFIFPTNVMAWNVPAEANGEIVYIQSVEYSKEIKKDGTVGYTEIAFMKPGDVSTGEYLPGTYTWRNEAPTPGKSIIRTFKIVKAQKFKYPIRKKQ